MTPDNNHEEIKKLLVENQRLLIENNQLLNKMRRAAVLGSIFKFVWFLVILGLPVYMYLNYIAPNIDTIKENYSAFGEISKDTGYFKRLYENLRPSEQN
jgi:hypothetical protein